MTIYRGPGGTGSASSEVDTTEFQEFLVQAQAAKEAAESALADAEAARDAALAAETNAELAEVNAETAETNAETAETNANASASAAASSASAAATSASNAATSASSAAASAASIDPANLVHISGTETITGAKTFSSTIIGSVSGNAGTVTDGVVTTGSYSNPSWITSLAGSKVSGNISGNAANVTGTVAVANGGTGATTASGARANLDSLAATNPSYTGTLTGGTGVVNLGAGQFYKDASGNVGFGTASPSSVARVSFGNSSAGSQNLWAAYFATNSDTASAAPNFGLAIGWNRSGGGGESNIVYGTGVGSASGLAFSSSNGTTVTERARIDSSGQLKTMVTGGSAVMDAYACRAWVNFNGTGTVAIRASGNVSSITDNGTGNYTVNFTNAMPDINYSVNATTSGAIGSDWASAVQMFTNTSIGRVAPTTSAFSFVVLNKTASAYIDPTDVLISVFR